jgi:hypothetical protein
MGKLSFSPVQDRNAMGKLSFSPVQDRNAMRKLSSSPIQDRNAMGAPGLAFETWDPPSRLSVASPIPRINPDVVAPPPALPPELPTPQQAWASSHLPTEAPQQ